MSSRIQSAIFYLTLGLLLTQSESIFVVAPLRLLWEHFFFFPPCSKNLTQICTDFCVPLHRALQWTLWEESWLGNALLSNNYSIFWAECSSLVINTEIILLTLLRFDALRGITPTADLHQLQQAGNRHPAIQSEIKCGGECTDIAQFLQQ